MSTQSTACNQTSAWAALCSAFNAVGQSFDLRSAFATDAERYQIFSQSAPHLFADLSKNLIDSATEQMLLDLARQTGVEQHRDAMFAGAAITGTEGRAVMHWLL